MELRVGEISSYRANRYKHNKYKHNKKRFKLKSKWLHIDGMQCKLRTRKSQQQHNNTARTTTHDYDGINDLDRNVDAFGVYQNISEKSVNHEANCETQILKLSLVMSQILC